MRRRLKLAALSARVEVVRVPETEHAPGSLAPNRPDRRTRLLACSGAAAVARCRRQRVVPVINARVGRRFPSSGQSGTAVYTPLQLRLQRLYFLG